MLPRTINPLYRDGILLYFIVLIGALLRFYGFFEMSFTHDELSALHRLGFQSFSKLIEKGVMTDVHPPGVQVFLYGWTSLVGKNDQLVKLPFLLFGIGSIVLSYFLSRAWFNSTVALLVATCVATLQLPVMYSQIARPYASGLFFSLLMVYFWSKLLFEYDRSSKINVIGFVTAGAICCYNHHFSLLFTGIVCITGLFYVNLNTIKTYILSIGSIAILYVPNLPIILHQLLGRKGLSWLGKPDYDFIIDHVQHIFHYHPIIYIAVTLIVLMGIWQHGMTKLNKFQIISLCWFLIPLTIGVLYSIYVKPVLQHSVLIFSFPFLLIFLFSFYRSSTFVFKVVTVVLLMVVNISTLVWSRDHYEILYNLPFQKFATLTSDFLEKHDKDNVTIVFNKDTTYINHYFSKHNPGVDYISIFRQDIDPVAFRQLVSDQTTQYFVAGGLPPHYISVVRDVYPNLVEKDFGLTYEYYIFSKNKSTIAKRSVNDIIYSNKNDFEANHTTGQHQNVLIRKAKGNHFCLLKSSMEWGPEFDTSLTDIVTTRHVFVDAMVDFKINERKKGLLVCSISRNDSTVAWKGVPVDRYYDSTRADQWQKAYLSMRLTHHFEHNSELKNCRIQVFFWNKYADQFMIDNLTVRFRDGNKQVYGTVDNMD